MTESDFNNVSRTLLNAIRKFYEKEENRKAFKIWQAERQKLQLNNKKLLGIPFVITNYFCGNKSVFAVLNSHQRTLSTISVVCLAKTVPQDGDFFSAKMRSTEKSAFLDDFSRARGSRTRRTAIEWSRKRVKKTPFR